MLADAVRSTFMAIQDWLDRAQDAGVTTKYLRAVDRVRVPGEAPRG